MNDCEPQQPDRTHNQTVKPWTTPVLRVFDARQAESNINGVYDGSSGHGHSSS